jgi:hypothetical protein
VSWELFSSDAIAESKVSRLLTRRIMAAIARPILHISAVTRTFLPEFRRYRPEDEIERTERYWWTDRAHEGCD